MTSDGHFLWRAVDQDGAVLEIRVHERRDAKAAQRFFRRLPKGLQYVPRVIVTDKLRSDGVAKPHQTTCAPSGRRWSARMTTFRLTMVV
jgi:transposase-like protein